MDLFVAGPLILPFLTRIAENALQPVIHMPPPLPAIHQPYHIEDALQDLELSAGQKTLISERFVSQWKATLYAYQGLPAKELNPQSGIGHLLEGFSSSLNKWEENMKSSVISWFYDNTDEMDRSVLEQLKKVLLTVRSTAKYIGKYTIEGQFLGQVEKQEFTQATTLAFTCYIDNEAKAKAYGLIRNEKDVVLNLQQQKKADGQYQYYREKTDRWYTRWLVMRQVATLYDTLQQQTNFLEKILEKREGLYQKEYKSLSEEILRAHYRLLSLKRLKLQLAAATYNLMLSLKPRPRWETYCEKTLQFFYKQLNQWMGHEVTPTPSFIELYPTGVLYSQKVLEEIGNFTPFSCEETIIYEEYLEALNRDAFMEAKGTLLLNIPRKSEQEERASFDWLQEAAHFDSYKKRLDHLFNMQNQVVYWIWKLNQAPMGFLDYPFLLKDFWAILGQGEILHLQLREGFMKRFYHDIQKSKSLFTRMIESTKTKLFRRFKEGYFCDQTPKWEVALQNYQTFHSSYKRAKKNLKKLFSWEKVSSHPYEKLLKALTSGPTPFEYYESFYTLEGLESFKKKNTSLQAQGYLLRHLKNLQNFPRRSQSGWPEGGWDREVEHFVYLVNFNKVIRSFIETTQYLTEKIEEENLKRYFLNLGEQGRTLSKAVGGKHVINKYRVETLLGNYQKVLGILSCHYPHLFYDLHLKKIGPYYFYLEAS